MHWPWRCDREEMACGHTTALMKILNAAGGQRCVDAGNLHVHLRQHDVVSCDIISPQTGALYRVGQGSPKI